MTTFMKPLFILIFMMIAFISCSSQKSDVSSLLLRVDGKESAYPRLSKDDTKILYQSNKTGNWQLFIMDIATKTQTPVLSDTFNNNFPDWSSDNKSIAFTSDRDGNEEIYVMNSDGTGLKRITNDPGRDIHPYFSPDGHFIMISSTRGNGSFDIYRYSIDHDLLERLTDTPEDETCARYSPDMKHLVFLRNSIKSDDVFLMDVDHFTIRNLTNTPAEVDGWPMFSYDDHWVYYSSHDSGSFCIYRIKTDGTMKTKLTSGTREDEDARVCVSKDGKWLIYNRKTLTTIEIRALKNI